MEKEKNTPALRFPEFKGDTDSSYQRYFFKDIFLFSTGKNIKQNEASPEFKTPCIRYGELYYMYNEVIYEIINRTNLDESQLLLSKGDEILLPSAGEDPLDIGSASALTLENIAIGRTINILRPMKDSIYSQSYVAYYINHKLRKKISTLAKGVSISNVYNSDLKKLEIILPNLPEQQKIANFLTSVDSKLTQFKQKKTILEQYKKGVMQKIFSQEIRFKKDDGEEFPNWEEKRLGDYLIKHEEKATENNQYPVLTSSRKGLFFQKDYFDGNDVASKDTTGYNVVPRNYFTYRHMSDDITFKFNINTICDKGIVSTLYPVFTTKNTDSRFLLTKLNEGTEFKEYATQQKQGGSRTYMYFSKLAELQVVLPCLAEQTKIANFLSAIDEKIDHCGSRIEKTEFWKKGLLQKMFV